MIITLSTLKKVLRAATPPKFRYFGKDAVARATAAYVRTSWRRSRRHSTPHSLAGVLAITLTSFRPRFHILSLTLKSLLSQSVRADHVYLWIAKDDLPWLPSNVIDLQTDGLIIRACDDLRSYKKIIPALQCCSNEYLVTADDDIYYPPHWLRDLVAAYCPGRKEVICLRAHRIRVDTHGMPLPYGKWEGEVQEGGDPTLLFPTSGGGVLYPPGIFFSDVTREEIFREACPTADDVWLYWMAALAGAEFRKVGPRWTIMTWYDSQRVALNYINIEANDRQIANMIARYGFPGR